MNLKCWPIVCKIRLFLNEDDFTLFFVLTWSSAIIFPFNICFYLWPLFLVVLKYSRICLSIQYIYNLLNQECEQSKPNTVNRLRYIYYKVDILLNCWYLYKLFVIYAEILNQLLGLFKPPHFFHYIHQH